MWSEPIEIRNSFARFKKDHPDRTKTAFLIMEFGATQAHTLIAEAVKAGLEAKGIVALRADDKQYHDDLFPNVLTYMYGCAFGVAVFERIETDKFNPNVALEVGYMQAMGKPVLLLKDRTLNSLHTDLVGKLYRTFDPYDPTGTIPREIAKWLLDKDLPSAQPAADVLSLPVPTTSVATPDERGANYVEARLRELSQAEREDFERMRTIIDAKLKELPRNHRGLPFTFTPDTSSALVRAVRDIYNEAGWLVRVPERDREGRAVLTIEQYPR